MARVKTAAVSTGRGPRSQFHERRTDHGANQAGTVVRSSRPDDGPDPRSPPCRRSSGPLPGPGQPHRRPHRLQRRRRPADGHRPRDNRHVRAGRGVACGSAGRGRARTRRRRRRRPPRPAAPPGARAALGQIRRRRRGGGASDDRRPWRGGDDSSGRSRAVVERFARGRHRPGTRVRGGTRCHGTPPPVWRRDSWTSSW
jgi:hypothetical protein